MDKQEKEYALEVWYDTRFDDARFEKARKISIEALEGVAIPTSPCDLCAFGEDMNCPPCYASSRD